MKPLWLSLSDHNQKELFLRFSYFALWQVYKILIQIYSKAIPTEFAVPCNCIYHSCVCMMHVHEKWNDMTLSDYVTLKFLLSLNLGCSISTACKQNSKWLPRSFLEKKHIYIPPALILMHSCFRQAAYFSVKSGHDDRFTMWKVLASIIHDEVVQQCSWRGSSGMKGQLFKISNILSLVLAM